MSPSIAQIREELVKGSKDKSSYMFDTSLRQRYVEIMKTAGYSEQKEFENADLSKGYWCNTCEYFQAKFTSPTDYWCSFWLFPDRKFGCCRAWSAKE